jgi:hypothetical protein
MQSIPEDPNTSRPIFLGIANWSTGQYSYTSIKKWWIWGNAFVLMAGTETEWGSNWVSTWLNISPSWSYDDIKLCKIFTSHNGLWTASNDGAGNCVYYKWSDQLRYIYLY